MEHFLEGIVLYKTTSFEKFFYVYVDRLLFYTSAMLQLYFRKKLENKRLHQNDNNTVICFFKVCIHF